MKLLPEFYFTHQLLQSEFCSENLFFNMIFKREVRKTCLILCNLGPFSVGEKGILPLWFLLALEKMRFGNLIKPKWLKTKWLKKKIFLEIDEENLECIPRNYFETIYIFHKHRLNNLGAWSRQLLLIEELFSIRIEKLAIGLLMLKVPIRAIKLKFLGNTELINFRKILQIQLLAINIANFT